MVGLMPLDKCRDKTKSWLWEGYTMRKIFGKFGLIEHYRWRWTQKVHCFRHGHPKSAHWDINGWFIDNIIELLDSFIENPFLSSPMIWDEDEGDYIADPDWRDKLRLMRYGFARYKAVCEDMVGYEEMKAEYGLPGTFRFEDNGDGKLFRLITDADTHPDRFEEFQEAWLEEEKKAKMALDRSLELFSKHFLDLWD